MKSYDLKKEGAALRADFESMPAIAPDLWDFVIIKDWEEEFLALHQWLISGFFPYDSPAMITETGLPRGGEPAPRQMRFPKPQKSFGDKFKPSGIETKVTVSSVPTSVPETQDRGKTSVVVRQPNGTRRDLAQDINNELTPRRGLSPAMSTESPKRETPVRQPSQIGRDLAPDNELTDQSVTGDTIPERLNGGKIGTLRDLAQDINNEQSFDLKPETQDRGKTSVRQPRDGLSPAMGTESPKRETPVRQPSQIGRDLAPDNELTDQSVDPSVTGDTRSNGGKIGTLRDLAQDINNELTEQMITESPKHDTGMPISVVRQPSKIGTLRDFAQDNELTAQSFDLKPAELPRRSVAGVKPNDGKFATLRDLSPAMITETQDRKIGTLHDLAQDNELTPRRSVDAPQSHVARIGTLRDLAQDIKSTFDLKPGVPESIDDYELTEQSLKPAELPRRSESIDTPENLSAGLPKPHSSVDASFVPGADIELLLDTIRKEIESEYKRYYGES
jgi:hypothetical protein